jgi:putative Holliday junction resolvase
VNARSTPIQTTSHNNTFLGFDFGLRRIGVAVGQRVSSTATSLTVLRAADGTPDWSEIEALVREWSPAGFVLGIPRSMDGEETDMTRAARRFGNALSRRFGLNVHEMDERLSSIQAEGEFAEARKRGGVRRKHRERLDAAAARVILEDWLRNTETGE